MRWHKLAKIWDITTWRSMSHHHHHHRFKPLSIPVLDVGLSIPFPWQFVWAILLPSNRSPEVIDFIPPSLRGCTSSSTTIHGSPVCYLRCLSTVLNASYVTGLSQFSGFNDVHDVTNHGFRPYPLVCPIVVPGHTNHCPSIFLWAAASRCSKALDIVQASDA